jgi:hypothetical protein
VQTDAPLLAHLFTKAMGIDGNQAPIEIEVIIRRVTDAKTVVHKEEPPLASGGGHKGFPYVHTFPTTLRGLGQPRLLEHWPHEVKNSLINQALVH